MEITEVRIFLKEGPDKKLKAYATLTLDNSFVVRNVKVIQGNKGLFVAMPSRKIRESCPKCNYKNAVRSKFCNQCGSNLPQPQAHDPHTASAVRQSEHKDIAHPITLECRELIQKKVLSAYESEQKRGPQPPQATPEPKQAEPKATEAPAPTEAPIEAPIEENEDDIEGKDITL